MIYILFIFSMLAALLLNIWQRYLEYFPARRTQVYQPERSFVRKTILRNFFRPGVLDEEDKASRVKVGLINGFKKFFISFSIVALFYSALQLWLEVSAYSGLAQATVLDIETRIHKINERFQPFDRVKFLPEVILIALLIGLASSWPFIEKMKLKKRYEQLMKAAGWITGLFTIAVAFSFFGSQFKKGEKGVLGSLKVHEFRIIKDNKLLVKQVEQKVKEEIVRHLLENSTVTQLIADEEAAGSSIDSLVSSQDYKFYLDYRAQDDSFILNTLSVLKPGSGPASGVENFQNEFVKRNTNFIREHPDAEVSPLKRQSSYEAADFYDAISEQRYEAYKDALIIHEGSVSENSIKRAYSVLSAAAGETPPRILTEYGDLGVKIFDNAYSLTAQGWINDALSGLFNIPLLGEVLGPFHDAWKDLFGEKVKKILVAISTNNQEAAAVEFSSIGKEMDALITAVSVKDNLRSRYREKLNTFREKVVNCVSHIRSKNNLTKEAAARHLEELKGKCRWQRIREEFAAEAAVQRVAEEPIGPFSKEQWEEFDAVLREWESYMDKNKLVWFKNNTNDLEPLFYAFIKQDPKACGAWGFILQQNDWNGAVNYYSYVAPDPTATGKPYYLLKYYCNTARCGNVDELYTSDVEEQGVALFCPK